MKTFIMFGKYTPAGLKKMSPDRTRKALNIIKNAEGKVKAIYALLGEWDLIFICSFPDMEQAIKASIALSKLTEIMFTTAPAVTVEEFDEIIADL